MDLPYMTTVPQSIIDDAIWQFGCLDGIQIQSFELSVKNTIKFGREYIISTEKTHGYCFFNNETQKLFVLKNRLFVIYEPWI